MAVTLPKRYPVWTAITLREPCACWALVGIGGPLIGEVILAQEPERLVGRGDRPGSVGGNASFPASLDLLAVVVPQPPRPRTGRRGRLWPAAPWDCARHGRPDRGSRHWR